MGIMEFAKANSKNLIRGAIVVGGVIAGLLIVGANNKDEDENTDNGELIVVEATEVSTQENEPV